ncbi:hypothetical protein MTR67_045638 [Solanum verrucosum]|uniref:Glycerol-3-phosphate acyltransferase RAM2 n=1 Tax=Solanum verrucosum TaxID=315347 RepID=A0AAF0USM4_SOLVR|nr:hypothetical protein MTR67_045638 [Solanum verrucosum]
MVEKCTSIDRENDTVVTDLDGTLLRSRNSFAYFALVAFNVGGVLRLLFLLLASPIVGILYYFISESAGIQVIVFATFVGMKVSDVESAARHVLPKFYLEDLHPESWRVFSSCGKRCVLTATPRIMVEPFLKDYLGTDIVLGTEIETYKGRATGFVKSPGVLVGKNKADTLTSTFGDTQPEIGLGDRDTDIPFMTLCKEGYFVPSNLKVKAEYSSLYYAFWATGIRLIINGIPPLHIKKSEDQSGVLFVCCHKTILDNIFLSAALDRPIPVITYSTSQFFNIFSLIKTITLTGDRTSDASMIKHLLKQRDLTIFPEGTTNRGQFLLRFSSLFAEITDEIVPVAIENKMSMFHGTTTRGWKWMDPFFFLMNPRPTYEITFLNKLSYEFTCKSGKSSHEVATYVQKVIGETLSYECTTFTRKDKYMALDTIVKNP